MMKRRSITWLATGMAIALSLLLASCGGGRISGVLPGGGGGTYKVGAPYKVGGVWYYPKEDYAYDRKGIASWYGDKFHGRRTANGERFDMNLLSAAHPTLPMPWLVRVTNLENGRSVVVRVNDRGPFVRGRLIDLSRRAAEVLGFRKKGVARVRVKALGPAKSRHAPRAPVIVAQNPPPRTTSTALSRSGASRSVASRPATIRRVAALSPASGAGYEDGALEILPVTTTRLYVQAGAFADAANAERLRARLAAFGPAVVSKAWVDGRLLYRVRIGPIPTVAGADNALARVVAQGQNDARLVLD
jgi:rare lipoprotein A